MAEREWIWVWDYLERVLLLLLFCFDPRLSVTLRSKELMWWQQKKSNGVAWCSIKKDYFREDICWKFLLKVLFSKISFSAFEVTIYWRLLLNLLRVNNSHVLACFRLNCTVGIKKVRVSMRETGSVNCLFSFSHKAQISCKRSHTHKKELSVPEMFILQRESPEDHMECNR